MRGKNGLTLIELTIVLAVISVITAGAMMSFDVAERRLLYNTSLALQADLRYAQRRAMIEGHTFGIKFYYTEGYYSIYHLGARMPLKEVKLVKLPKGVSFQRQPPIDLHYLPRGTLSAGFTIALRTENYIQELTGTVSGGRIKIQDMIFD
jgi:prepilin-type N-terminal cleavage/methylation domain-containing protein